MIDFAPTYPGIALNNPLVRRLGLHGRATAGHRMNQIMTRDNFTCVYCGTDLLASLDSLIMASLDHIIPKSAGGTNDPSNLVASCYACNQVKHNVPACSMMEGRAVIGRHRAILMPLLRERFAELGFDFPRQLDRSTHEPMLAEVASILASQVDDICRAVQVISKLTGTEPVARPPADQEVEEPGGDITFDEVDGDIDLEPLQSVTS